MSDIVCSKCKVPQNESGFYRRSTSKSGYMSWCKKCYAVYQQSPKYKEIRKKYAQSPKVKALARQYKTKNADKIRIRIAQCRTQDPIRFRAVTALTSIRKRSKKNNVFVDITQQNLIDMQNESDTCPCCFEPFDFSVDGSHNPHSPSVDRMIPELGYVPGNVKMICSGCNTRKNSSSIEQIKQILRYMEKYQVCKDITV